MTSTMKKAYDGVKDISKKVSNGIKKMSNGLISSSSGSTTKPDINNHNYTYIIYNPKLDFYNDVFMSNIYNIIENRKTNVRTNFFDKNNKLVENIELKGKIQNKQQERIIKDYMIPLSYLIYSYIYQRFYILQQKRDIMMENKLNYKMYQYFFSHKNPVIKKVNVYFYNLYNNLLPSSNKNNKNSNKVNSNGDIILPEEINQYIIPEIRKGNTKDELIAFLNEVNNKIKKDDLNFNLIIQNLNKLELKTNDINKIFLNILENFKKSSDNADQLYSNKVTEYDKLSENDKKFINTKIIDTEEIKKIIGEKDLKKKEIDDLNTEKNKLDTELKIYIDDRLKLKKNTSNSLEKLKKTLKEDYNQELQKLKEKRKEYDREISIIETRCSKISPIKVNEVNACRTEVQELIDKKAAINIKIKEIETIINTTENEIKKKTKEKEDISYDVITKNETTRREKSIEDINIKIKKATSDLNEIKNRYINKFEEFKKKQTKLKKVKSDMEKNKNNMEKLNDEYDKINIILNNIKNSTNNNSTNIYEIINKLKFNKIKDYNIYLKYKNDYDIILTKYKDLCNTIKLINKNILNINIEKKQIIKEDEISIDTISSIKKYYKEINDKHIENNEIYDIISNKNKEINNYFENEKELIKILFNSMLNKNNKNKVIKNYLDEIIDTKINIFNDIINIINEFIDGSKILTIDKTTFKIIYNNIKKDIDISSFKNKNPLFQILYYIYKSIIYEEIIELNYLLNIIYNVTNITEDNYIKIDGNISKIITDIKYKYDTIFRKFKKEDKENEVIKLELIQYQKTYNQNIIEYKDTIDFLTEKLKDGNYNSLIAKKINNFDKQNKLYKNKKNKKNQADQILNELNIKKGNKTSYQSSALFKIKDPNIKAQIEKSIKDFINNRSEKITVTNKGVSTTKTIQPDNNIIKNKIYNLVKNYYQKNIDINTKNNKIKRNKDEEEKYKLEFEKDNIIKEKEIKTVFYNNYNEYILDINNKLIDIESNKIKNDQNKKDIKDILNIEFNKLIELSEKIEDIEKKNEYDSTNNKIYFYIGRDEIFNEYFKNKTDFNNKIKQNSIEKKNKISIFEHNLNANNKKIFSPDKILKYFYFNEYLEFLNEYFTKQKFFFINEVNKIYKNLKEDSEIKPFFEEYMNHFKKLLFKINNLLNQINLDIIMFKIEKVDDLDPYFNIINKKIETINKINDNSNENINNNKGKYTTILPYTDSMFLYIIYLTMIIDYLTFFFE